MAPYTTTIGLTLVTFGLLSACERRDLAVGAVPDQPEERGPGLPHSAPVHTVVGYRPPPPPPRPPPPPPQLPRPSASASARARAAGGRAGKLQVILTWEDRNDLDLMVTDPKGHVIFFGKDHCGCGGSLDVDRNRASTTTRPVENVVWAERDPPKGRYTVRVWFFARKGPPTSKFEVTVKCAGIASTYRGEARSVGTKQVVKQFDCPPI